MSKGYDPSATSAKIGGSTYTTWINSTIEEDVQTVPGIGEKYKEVLHANGIRTTHQLLGKFLSLKEPAMDIKAHMDAFYAFLADIGIGGYRALICRAVAEKLDTFMPGIYSDAAYE